jgi:hypothetical protein
MKIIAIILTSIGFVLCFFGNIGVQYLLRQTLAAMMDSQTSGIGAIASGFENTMLAGYVAIFGSVLVFLGILINIIALFTGRKRQTV